MARLVQRAESSESRFSEHHDKARVDLRQAFSTSLQYSSCKPVDGDGRMPLAQSIHQGHG